MFLGHNNIRFNSLHDVDIAHRHCDSWFALQIPNVIAWARQAVGDFMIQHPGIEIRKIHCEGPTKHGACDASKAFSDAVVHVDIEYGYSYCDTQGARKFTMNVPLSGERYFWYGNQELGVHALRWAIYCSMQSIDAASVVDRGSIQEYPNHDPLTPPSPHSPLSLPQA